MATSAEVLREIQPQSYLLGEEASSALTVEKEKKSKIKKEGINFSSGCTVTMLSLIINRNYIKL